MQTAHTVIVLLLSLIFLVSGLSKASGSPAGLSGTRDVNVSDGIARLVGIFETLSAMSLVIGFAMGNADLKRFGLVAIWFTMAGALYFHFRANKVRTAFPAMLFLVLSTIALATL